MHRLFWGWYYSVRTLIIHQLIKLFPSLITAQRMKGLGKSSRKKKRLRVHLAPSLFCITSAVTDRLDNDYRGITLQIYAENAENPFKSEIAGIDYGK